MQQPCPGLAGAAPDRLSGRGRGSALRPPVKPALAQCLRFVLFCTCHRAGVGDCHRSEGVAQGDCLRSEVVSQCAGGIGDCHRSEGVVQGAVALLTVTAEKSLASHCCFQAIAPSPPLTSPAPWDRSVRCLHGSPGSLPRHQRRKQPSVFLWHHGHHLCIRTGCHSKATALGVSLDRVPGQLAPCYSSRPSGDGPGCCDVQHVLAPPHSLVTVSPRSPGH